MKKASWNEIRDGLRQARVSMPAPADEFWADFKARAQRVAQEAPEVEAAALPVWRWALAAACVLIAVGVTAGGLFLRPGGNNASIINSFEVVASHRAVLIMSDDAHKATILCVVGMDDDDEEEGDNT